MENDMGKSMHSDWGVALSSICTMPRQDILPLCLDSTAICSSTSVGLLISVSACGRCWLIKLSLLLLFLLMTKAWIFSFNQLQKAWKYGRLFHFLFILAHRFSRESCSRTYWKSKSFLMLSFNTCNLDLNSYLVFTSYGLLYRGFSSLYLNCYCYQGKW